MDECIFVAQLNVDHYRRKLAEEQDAATREMLSRLLAEEEAKLAALTAAPAKKRKKLSRPLAWPPVGR